MNETKTLTAIEMTMQQCIDLAALGYITVDGVILYKQSKHQYLSDALNACRSIDKIYGNKHMYFILSEIPKQ